MILEQKWKNTVSALYKPNVNLGGTSETAVPYRKGAVKNGTTRRSFPTTLLKLKLDKGSPCRGGIMGIGYDGRNDTLVVPYPLLEIRRERPMCRSVLHFPPIPIRGTRRERPMCLSVLHFPPIHIRGTRRERPMCRSVLHFPPTPIRGTRRERPMRKFRFMFPTNPY